MWLKFYIVEKDGKVESEGVEEKNLFNRLRESGIKKAILFGKDTAIYFETLGDRCVMVGVDRFSAGFAKIYARKILKEEKKKIDLKSLEDAFEFAERVEKANLDELAKLR